jgi:putative FmdB family regulatory protein
MPRYDYVCEQGHEFERTVPLAQFDYAQKCECGAMARQRITGPAIHTSEGARAAFDERAYRTHNITATQIMQGGAIKAEPVRDGLQCQCGNCASHRKRNAVTKVVAPGKAV